MREQICRFSTEKENRIDETRKRANESGKILNYNRSLRALQTVTEMKQEAVKDQHPYGIYTCIRSMSRIYYSRGQFPLANEYNMQALDYMLKELPDQGPTQLYVEVAQCYTRENKYGLALEYIKKAEVTIVIHPWGLLKFCGYKYPVAGKVSQYDFHSAYYRLLHLPD